MYSIVQSESISNKMDKQNGCLKNSTIWKTFEGRTREGHVKTFWIERLPEEYEELAINNFLEYFLIDEPLGQSLDIAKSEVAVEECRNIWRKIVDQKCTLACFTKDENMSNKLVAFNFCTKNSVFDDKIDYEGLSEKTRKILGFCEHAMKFENVYHKFNVNEYLGAMGLFTLPEYRGCNIGMELLMARKFLCKGLGLKLSVTLFTSPAGQRVAEKAGFKDVVPISLDEIEKNDPFLVLPNLRKYTKKVRVMYRFFE